MPRCFTTLDSRSKCYGAQRWRGHYHCSVKARAANLAFQRLVFNCSSGAKLFVMCSNIGRLTLNDH